MSRYYVPDALVCLGGAGIDIGQTFMSQEWILREVMEPDPHPNGPSDQGAGVLDAYFVDTSLEEEVTTGFVDHEDGGIETFDHLVDEIYDDVGTAPDRPAVHGIDLTDRTRDDWLSVASLTSDSTVRDRFAPPTGLQAWWLNDDTSQGQEPILQPVRDQFKQGVQRRRGLTKALYRISQADTDPLNEINTAPDSVDYVSIIAGLGGGSGSGLLLDVGRRLAADADVTLFAVLPRPDGGRDGTTEFRNTYAALSELEYLTLSNDSPFTNVVLLPYGAADSREDFDQAVVNAILAYYNVHDDPTNTFNRYDANDDNGPARYAPFTIAVPQVLNFLKDDIEESKDNFQTYQERIRTSQAAEAALYDQLEAFIADYYPEAEEADYRVDDETVGDIAEQYITSLRTLVDQPVIDDLDYDSADEFRKQVDDFLDNVDDDQSETRRLVEQFPVEQTRTNFEPGEQVENEAEFIDMLYASVELAGRRLALYEQKAYIRSEATEDDIINEELEDELDIRGTVADDLEKALSRSDTGSNRNLTGSFRTPIDDLSDELSGEIQAIEHLKQGAETRAEKLAGKWAEDVADELAAYQSHKELAEEAGEYLSSLEEAIDRRLKTAESATTETVDDLDERGTEFQAYEDLNDALRDIGIDSIDEDAVETAVRETVAARKAQLRVESKEGSIVEAVKGIIGLGDIPSHVADYRNAARQIDDDVIEGVHEDNVGGAFDPTLSRSLITAREDTLNEKDDDLRKDLLSAFGRFAERPSDHRGDLSGLADTAEAFDPDTDGNETVFDPDSGVLDAALDSDDPYTVEDAKSSFESDLDDETDWQDGDAPAARAQELVDDELTTLLATPFGAALAERRRLKKAVTDRLDAYTELSGDPDSDESGMLSEEGNEFANDCSNVPDIEQITVYENPSNDGRAFRTEARPEDPARIGTSDDLSGANLLSSDTERRELGAELSTMVGDTLTPGTNYLPFREYRPSADGQDVTPAVYNQHRGDLVVMSRLFDAHSDDDADFVFDETTEAVEDYFNFHPTEGFVSAQGELADAWDVAVTYFIGGGFLDNLEPMASCRSQYLDAYDEHADTDYLHPLVARHTFGIDGLTGNVDDFLPDEADGAFTHRHDLLNPAQSADVAVLQGQTESEVIADLLSRHAVTGFDSVVSDMGE